jgi:hypothetical protein
MDIVPFVAAFGLRGTHISLSIASLRELSAPLGAGYELPIRTPVACRPDRPPVPPPPMPASVPSLAPTAQLQPTVSEVSLLPEVPRFQSAQLPPPTVYTPGPTAPSIPYAPPLGSSPVTGYGVGGMQQPPGAPPNPPYSPGGLLH